MEILTRPRKAIVYVRVSTKKQATNFSLETQDKDCREYAQRHDINNVLMSLSDVSSGLNMKGRPGLRKLYEMAMDPSNGITDVIFWELDRFTRRIRDFVNIVEELVEAGITIHLASEEEQYTQQNAQAWVMRSLGAQGESAKISKRTKTGQTAAIEEGRNIGPKPWGYIIHHPPGQEDKAGWLIPDPETFDYAVYLWELERPGKNTDAGRSPVQPGRHTGAWRRAVDRRTGPIHLAEQEIHGRPGSREEARIPTARISGQDPSDNHRGSTPGGGERRNL